jgi:hypothetical protein
MAFAEARMILFCLNLPRAMAGHITASGAAMKAARECEERMKR